MEDEDAGNDNEDNINARSEKTGNYNIPMFTTSAGRLCFKSDSNVSYDDVYVSTYLK